MKPCFRSLILGGAVLLFSVSAWAAKIQLAPGLGDASLNINLQLQAWVQSIENTSPSTTGWNTQVFMRRIRPIISGDITKEFHFFFQLDSPNFGRNSVPGVAPSATDPTGLTGRVLVQDAQLIYEPTPGIFIEAGELLLPLSHNQVQSTTSFVTLDLHSNTIRFPGATAPNQATNGLRELGVATRGWLLDKRLGFRFGVYNGVRGTPGPYDATAPASLAGVNPDGVPQIGGYLHWNFLDSEERGWLYQGVYFNDKPILSIGAGAGFQPKAIRNQPGFTTTPQDWRALAADIYAAVPPAPDQEIIFQFDYYNYDFGNGNPNTGNGFFGDLGYRFGVFQPFVSYEYFSASDTHANDARIWTAGINWWFKRLNSLKLSAEATKVGALAGANVRSISAQWQLFF